MEGVTENLDLFWSGYLRSLGICLWGMVGSLLLGTLIASFRVSPIPSLRWFGTAWVTVIRNCPLTVVLFFFAFGLSIDPGAIGTVLVPAVGAIAATLCLSIAAAIGAARINGLDRQAAANIAFSIAARGEFALILVTLAAGADLDERLAPFVAVYVLVLALVSPILAHRSSAFVRFIPERLLPVPRVLATADR